MNKNRLPSITYSKLVRPSQLKTTVSSVKVSFSVLLLAETVALVFFRKQQQLTNTWILCEQLGFSCTFSEQQEEISFL